VLKIDLSHSWDYILEGPPITTLGSRHASDGPPPFLMYSAVTYDSDGDVFIEGGARATFENTCNVTSQHPMLVGAAAETASWSLSKADQSWKAVMSRLPDSSSLKTQSLYVQAPDQNLVFYLHGILGNSSSDKVYPKMTIINTRSNISRTVSTESMSPSGIRVEAAFLYLPLLGRKGGLVLLGGATRRDENTTTDPWGTMVHETYAMS
jgi:hypothetical protein